MERINTKNLISKLNEGVRPTDSENYGTISGGAILNEELWGKENGIYRPVGKLELPIQYVISGQGPEQTNIGLISIFNRSFFENPNLDGTPSSYETCIGLDGEEFAEGIFGYLKESDQYKLDTKFIESTGLNVSGESMVSDHVSKFFELYSGLEGATKTESERMVRQSFTDYQK